MTFSALIIFVLIAIFIRGIFFKPITPKKTKHKIKNSETYLSELNKEIKKKEQELNVLLLSTEPDERVKGSWKRNNWQNF